MNGLKAQSPLIETTSTVNSEQNSLILCNLPNDQKSSANSKSGSAERRDRRISRLGDRSGDRSGDPLNETCTSPNPMQTAGKPSNGVSNYNIETLLAETANLKRNSDRLLAAPDDNQNNNNQPQLPAAFSESDLFKQADPDKNSKLYRDCLYNFYFNYYYNLQNAFGDQLKN